MSRPQHLNLRSPRHSSRENQSHRRGSTLLVVVALMGLLALLGVMFFTFAQQEEENAKNYHEAAKYIHDPELGPDVYFDWALRQLIVGPNQDERNSALWGGHLSLLPNAYGRDAHPHTGPGWGLSQLATYDMSGNLTALSSPWIDLNGDGVADSGLIANDPRDLNRNGIPDVMEINRSPAAHVLIPGGGSPNYAFEFRPDVFPEPDVDYTYPDHNNPFLAYIGKIQLIEDLNGNGALDPGEPDYDGNGVVTPRQLVSVIKPSFLRPELLQRGEQDFNGNGTLENEDANGDGWWDPNTEDANGNGFPDIEDFNRNGTQDDIARLDPTWTWGSWSRSLSLRPHPDHYFIPPIVPGQNPTPPTVKRYLNDNDPTDVAIIGSLPGGSRGFPFNGRRNPTDQNDVKGLRYGVWTGYRQGAVAHEFDVDADNDGVHEAILLDLNFPPQERPSDGALYVPIFGLTVYDLDALINLNVHGNLAGNTSPPGSGGYFGNGVTPPANYAQTLDARISKSLQGLSPSEINPQWALDADPYIPGAIPGFTGDLDASSPTSDYVRYFERSPMTNVNAILMNRWELANMEWWWLNKGRVEFAATGTDHQIFAGRLGEAERVFAILAQSGGSAPITANVPGFSHLFPYPGVWNQDDNRNANEGGLTNTNLGQTFAFQHPLSFTGRGRFTQPGLPKIPNLVQSLGAGNPMQWIGYDGVGMGGTANWGQGLIALVPPAQRLLQNSQSGMLFRSFGPDGTQNTADDYLVDDMDEITVDPARLRRPYDEVFTYSDSAMLHLSKTDIDQTGTYSRIRDLMPGNINPSNATASANERRHRFTTASWDRKQFSLPRLLNPGADGQPGQAGQDDNRNGVIDDPGELGWPGTDDLRAWEFNVDLDRDNLPEFPPEFSATKQAPFEPSNAYYGFHQNRPWDTASYGAFNPLGTICVDPFRPQLRRLLETEFGNRDQLRLQFKLSVNQILDVVRGQNSTGHPYYSPLEFRPLTPHATDSSLTSITTVAAGNALPALPPANDADREFWARYDRQRLCRDIYVMLYTLCADGQGQDATSVAGSTIFADPDLIREMAQFAVNMVDAMDRDNVCTIFEYDDNLEDGWDLDDQPWTTSEGGTQRHVVAGVESQELTFSETLWAYQQQKSADHNFTPFDETTPPPGGSNGYHFAYVELRNIAPQMVSLADNTVSTGNGEDSIWRLRWRDTDSPNAINVVESTTHNISNGNGIFFKANAGTINPGGLYTIATSNWTAADSADLFVDHDPMVTDMERIVPRVATVGSGSTSCPNSPSNLTPNTNLDLVHSQGTNLNRFHLANGSTGDFISGNYEPTAGGGNEAILVLERRANPQLPQLPVNQNPWVVVDYTRLRKRELFPGDSDTPATRLSQVTSRQRRQPLDAVDSDFNSSGDPIQNSIGANNTGAGVVSPFDVWQMHPDRDFASLAELMSVSLYGPDYQTRSIARSNRSPYNQVNDDEGPYVAAGKFLLPNPPNTTASGQSSTVDKGVGPKSAIASPRQRFTNNWHRLFGFLEVPSRSHRQLGDPLQITRLPGKVNVNTVRHPEVWAGVLDDAEVFSPPERDLNGNGAYDAFEDLNGDGLLQFGLPGRTADDTSRDWWFDLLLSRDGRHPDSLLTLPGTPSISTFVGGVGNIRIGGSRPFRDPGRMTQASTTSSPVEDTLLRSHPVAGGSTNNWTRRLFELGTENESESGTLHQLIKQRMLSKLMGNTTTRSNVFVVFIHVQFHEAYEDPATGAIRVAGQIDLNSDGRRDDGHRGFFILDRSTAEEAYDRRTGTFNWREIVKHRLTIH